MARYYFNTANGDSVRDVDGDELPDLDSAKRMAIDVMAELLPTHRDGVAQGGSFTITVLDAAKQPVFGLSVRPESF